MHRSSYNNPQLPIPKTTNRAPYKVAILPTPPEASRKQTPAKDPFIPRAVLSCSIAANWTTAMWFSTRWPSVALTGFCHFQKWPRWFSERTTNRLPLRIHFTPQLSLASYTHWNEPQIDPLKDLFCASISHWAVEHTGMVALEVVPSLWKVPASHAGTALLWLPTGWLSVVALTELCHLRKPTEEESPLRTATLDLPDTGRGGERPSWSLLQRESPR